MHIYPTPGLKVRDPVKRDFLPDEGREVPDSDIYWRRRLKVGDATLDPPKAASSVATKVAKTPSNEGSDSQ
ncbi:DUF2635 domain-containing protein [Pseudomonas bohemica]|uniref:DUF2635 domain-containing protein n=1 Tax=Pseudomonas bohemica TaxID=2044872 RepID=UPI000DA5ED98|nr:DUF2635 domain-containing protein [Pseudomonas bohemica]